jgi:thioredoxin 1
MAHASFSEIIGSETPTLIDFSAEWCGPCKMMKPILADLKRKMGDEVKIIKIDVDRNQGIASAYQVQSVPTLVLFKSGELKWRQAGIVHSEQLKTIIDRFK